MPRARKFRQLNDLPSIDVGFIAPKRSIEAFQPVRRKPGARADNEHDLFGYVGGDFYFDPDNRTDFSVDNVSRIVNANRGNELVFNINSFGGDYFDGVAIYNLIAGHDAPVTMSVLSMAGSAASVVLMAADRVRMGVGAQIMIHNSVSFAYGGKKEMASVANFLTKIDADMSALYAARMEIPVAKAVEYMDAETYFTADEAIEVGLADEKMLVDEVEDDENAKSDPNLTEADAILAEAGLSRKKRLALRDAYAKTLPNRSKPGAAPVDEDKPGAVDIEEKKIEALKSALKSIGWSK